MDKQAKHYCKFCDREVHIVGHEVHGAKDGADVAFKARGVKNPRSFVCGSCASDGGEYVTFKYEQA